MENEDKKEEISIGLTPKERKQKIIDKIRASALVHLAHNHFRGLKVKLREARPRRIMGAHAFGDQVRALKLQKAANALQLALNNWQVKHIWFTREDLMAYELRDGNPPSDSERPVWLRGLKLELDIAQMSHNQLAKILPGGEYDSMVKNKMNGMLRSQVTLKEDLITKPIIVGQKDN